MHKVEGDNYSVAHPLFAELAEFNLSVAAVLAGAAPGELYVDDMVAPRVAFVETPEGHYLAGDAAYRASYPALKEVIPFHAYLTFWPEAWEEKLGEVWVNRAARRHPRNHLLLTSASSTEWRQRIPDGFRVVRVDRSFLDQRDLQNHEAVLSRVEGWHSTEYFLEHGFGFCVLEGDVIASCCIADCVVGDQCEVGIATHSAYRRRGLATLAVSAAVEHALARGISAVGWHCLLSNRGSIAVAEKVGFVKERAYFAYSSVLPTENVADMTQDEYQEWANHYEQYRPDNAIFGYDAARAWALAANPERALEQLRSLIETGWPGEADWLARDWAFASMRGNPELEGMIAHLAQEGDNIGDP